MQPQIMSSSAQRGDLSASAGNVIRKSGVFDGKDQNKISQFVARGASAERPTSSIKRRQKHDM